MTKQTGAEDDELKVGDKVKVTNDFWDFATLTEWHGAPTVIAIDGMESWVKDRANRPCAWLRFTSNEGYYTYRSADIFDLERAQ